MFGLGGVGDSVQREAADILGQGQESAARRSFTREFSTEDFDEFGGSLVAGQYNELARFRVPSDTEYSFGFGKATAPENQGYVFFDAQTSTPSAVDGTLRLVVESSTGRNQEVVKDLATERLDASKVDRTQQVPLPEQVGSAIATEDAYLVLKMNPNADATVDKTESEMILPVTEYDLS